MRTIKELLEILLEHLKQKQTAYDQLGLCRDIYWLFILNKITNKEHVILDAYIQNHKPTNFRTIFRLAAYWWPEMTSDPKSKRSRIKYLERLIKNCKNDG